MSEAGLDTRREIRVLQLSIAWMLALRVWMMATYPLIDTTEARYGELARVTSDGGFWLMPHLAPTLPFFAKPPLSTWMAAGSYRLLGFHEFAFRLPSLLMVLVTAGLLWRAAADFHLGRTGRWMTSTVLATAPIVVVSAGAVMTDSAQMAVVAGAMVVSWRALRAPERRRWRLLFWTLLGVAALSKGLSTVVLIGLPIAAYAMAGEGIAVVCRALWDPLGLLIAAAISLAWYVPAERAYPGFLSYFLIGEHFQRFLEPGWSGDRYGHSHPRPFGMIWLFWIAGIATWSPIFIAASRRALRRDVASVSMPDRWLWCWTVAPLLFFTASRNTMLTYVLTAVPPFALSVGCWAEAARGRLRNVIAPFALGIAAAATLVGATWLPGYLDSRSARTLVAAAQQITPPRDLFVQGVYPFSASFYSRGAAHRADGTPRFDAVFRQPGALLVRPVAVADAQKARQPFRELRRNGSAVLVEVLSPLRKQR
jgi:4-amino-4-deoxy-L-arabinose transferase-like glycosyltransferase